MTGFFSRRRICSLLTTLLVAATGAQAQTWQWASQTTTGATGTQDARVNRVATDGQGNTYVVGDFSGTATFGSTQLTSSHNTIDVFVAKCSPSGQWLWAQSIGTVGIEYGYALAVDAAGNAYIGGGYGGGGCGGSYILRFGSTISLSSVTSGQCGGTPAVSYMAKISPSGVWQWAVGGNWISYIHDIALGADGNLTAVGTCNHNFTLGNLSSNQILAASLTDDAFAARFTSSGQGIWFARAVVNGRATGVGVDADGNAYVCGRYAHSSTQPVPRIGATTFPDLSNKNWFLAKVDNSGEWLWANNVGSGGSDVPADVAVDATGNAYVVGTVGGAIRFGTTNLPSAGGYYGVLAKCAPSGAWEWAKPILNCTDGPLNVNVDAAGNAYVAGDMNGLQMAFSPHTLTSTTAAPVSSYLAKINATGDWQWAQGLTTDARAMCSAPNGNLRVAGSFYQNRQLGTINLTASGYYDNVFVGSYTPAPAPTLSGFAPTSGAVGSTVTLTGTRFDATISVKIGGKDAVFTLVSPTELRAVVPAGAVTAPITVTTSTGSVATTPFTVLPSSISSFSPASGQIGATITIDGAGFVGVTSVKFGTKIATSFTVVSPTRVTAVVPTGAITGKISVVTSTTALSALNFTVLPPGLTSFSPAAGQLGATITIDGTNFTGATAVKFGTKAAASFTIVSPTRIQAVVPVGAITSTLAVTGMGGTGYSTTPFTVLPPAVSAFSPATGQVGTLVTIDGTAFTGATSVKFGTRATTSITVVSATRITALVPAGATTGAVSVVGTGGTGASVGTFTVVPAAVSSFSPATGPVGTVVTITGTGLLGATGVKFNGILATSFTVVSGTSIRATVPTGATTGRITVVAPGGTPLSAASFSVTGARETTLPGATPALSIYPNPAHGTLQIRVPEAARSVQVLDRTGTVVRSEPVVLPEATDMLISLDGLLPGIYTVRCGALTRRLVVE